MCVVPRAPLNLDVRWLTVAFPNSIPLAALNAWFWLVMVLIFGYVVFLNLSYVRLRNLHRETWEALSRPGLFNVDPRAIFAARMFLWSDRCRALGDGVLWRWGRIAYFSGLAGASAFLLLAVAAVIAPISSP